LFAQSRVRVRGRPLRRRGGARPLPPAGPRHVGERAGGRLHVAGARLARFPVREVPVAPAHQRAPHRRGRHRVPDDDHGRQRVRDFVIYQEMVYSKAQLFYEQLRYVVGDETMRRILRTYFSRWNLKHVDEDAFRAVAEEVSRQDLKWLFGEWLHETPLIDYRLKRVERRRLPPPDGRWRTTVTIERKGDGRMPVEIGDRDTIYARASGEPAVE